MKPLTAIILGAGDRGTIYARIMSQMPEKFRVVAVADPHKAHRDRVKEICSVPEAACYHSWEAILRQPKMADVAVISTMDRDHYAPAMQAIGLGYHLLLEKPAAPTVQECADIVHAAGEKGVSVLVCHVLRYTPFYGRIKQLLDADTIGKIMSVIAVEAVGNVHQSHSFVRGNWHSESQSTPMLLQKSCHDMDILQWLIGKPCKKIQSFGALTYFRPENAPQGAPRRCADGGCPVADTCPYNCVRLYYDDKENDWFRGAATNGISAAAKPTDAEVMQALKTTDYGLCVFHANNDVVDHQIVNMEFADHITVSFSMNAFNAGGRYIRIFGTKGELYANMSDSEITVYTFADRKRFTVPVNDENSESSGHGGGDAGIIRELYDYLNGNYTGYRAADIATSVKNHLLCFAAEQSRHRCTVVDLDDYFAQYHIPNQY
ncbi:MAG: Gfo/Idh/MocA family oxidoreductase [Oscillospiraceae bacterium]|nr:Gfo/Idh/MocA family oxidoreductase [Oscillospiraceae bacterium]